MDSTCANANLLCAPFNQYVHVVTSCAVSSRLASPVIDRRFNFNHHPFCWERFCVGSFCKDESLTVWPNVHWL